jgi:aquaporin Z
VKSVTIVGDHNIDAPAVGDNRTKFAAVVMEFLITFLLQAAFISSVCWNNTSGNSYFGLAIGFVILCGAGTDGDISGKMIESYCMLELSACLRYRWSI